MDDRNRRQHSVNDYYPDPNRFYDEDPASSAEDYREEVTDSSYYNNESSQSAPAEPSENHTNEDRDYREEFSDGSYDRDTRRLEENYRQNAKNGGAGRMMTCPKCRNLLPAASNFCNVCGYRFPSESDAPHPINNSRIDGYLTDDIVSFVGPNAGTYLRRFQKVSEGKISFNLAAAVFSNRWMAYRGMYRQAFAFSVVINLLSGIISYMILMMFQSAGTTITDSSSMQINAFSFMLTIAIGLIAGLIGDNMYWKYTKRQMDRMNCRGREAISNVKISKTLQALGRCRLFYAILIILFDMSCNELIVTALTKLLPN